MMRRHVWLASVLGLASSMLGCPSPAPTPDAATPMADAFVPEGTDAGPPGSDAGAPAGPVIATGTRAAPMPANVACAGTPTSVMPMAGAPVSGTMTVSALGLAPTPVANTMIQVYTGAGVVAACAAPGCQTVTTDGTGNATLTLPAGGWFAYRVPSNGASVPGLGFFYEWGDAAGANVTVTAISSAAAGIVAGQFNRELNTTTAAVSGSVRDCAGANVANLQIRMFRGATEIISGARADTMTPRISGVGDTAIPMPTPDGLTAFAGRFAGILPSAGGDVRIEAWGVTTAGGAPELVACEVVSVEPAAATVAVLGPYRSDYGAGHPCEGRRAM